jgi:DNA-binding phage protein
MYKNYRFKGKDPIVSELQTLVDAAAREAGTSEWGMLVRLAHDVGISPSTLWSWLHGPTRTPSHASVKAVVRALGYELTLSAKLVEFKPRKASW